MVAQLKGGHSHRFHPSRHTVPVLRKLYRGKVLAAIQAAAESGELPSSHLSALGGLYRCLGQVGEA
jgi:hypothetical protein